MNKVILYSTGCPKCSVLKKKLDEKGISYMEISDTSLMLSLGIEEVPVLSIDDRLVEFADAIRWIAKQ